MRISDWSSDVCSSDLADAHCPLQRPTNENGNGLIRRYVGKSTELSRFSDTDLRAIEDRINTMPRRVLGWATARQIYDHAVAMTTSTRRVLVRTTVRNYSAVVSSPPSRSAARRVGKE